MAIYKRCGRCGKRIPSGIRCSCGKVRHKEYDRYSRDKKSKQYYDSSEWSRSRAAALEADISIHAPARGATVLFVYFVNRQMNFNPRSREGSDDFWNHEYCAGANFNPRSREGSDGRCGDHQ